jgi:hypothetical protein
MYVPIGYFEGSLGYLLIKFTFAQVEIHLAIKTKA